MSKALLLILAPALCVVAAEQIGPKQSFEVSKTEHVPFTSAGRIHIQGSYGYLAVEGWDEPDVEISVIKSTDKFYDPGQREKQEQRFEKVRVVTEHPSETELTISTAPPVRKRVFILPRPWLPSPRHGMTPDYRIRVPRNSKLDVRHDNGYVWLSDITGDIDVRSHAGDMIVVLPEPGSYSIDARTGLGSVSSDFVGNGHRYMAGTHFVHEGTAPARQIYLRMGRGSIEVKNGAGAASVIESPKAQPKGGSAGRD
jgi:hypothetical protein